MIKITPDLVLDEKDVQFQFIRASGPGGQNVNKVATAVQLRFDVKNAALPDDVRNRLIKLAGKRMSSDGTLVIEARRFRVQERNRQDALDRLVELLHRATQKPKSRRKTQPTWASRQRRIEAKRRQSKRKRLRRPVSHSDE